MNKEGTLANELVTDTAVFNSLKASILNLQQISDTASFFIADLKEALCAYVEAFGLDEATARLNPPSSLRQLDLELEDLVRA